MSKCIGQAPALTAASRLVSRRTWTRVYCVYVLPLVPLTGCASAFIADFSERSPSAVSSRSRGPGTRRCHGTAHYEGTGKSREVHGETATPSTAKYTGVCGSCESWARFVDARLTIARELHAAHEQQGWPCGCASRCIGCIRRAASARFFPAHWFQLVPRLVCIVHSLCGAVSRYNINKKNRDACLLDFNDLELKNA